MNIEELRQYCLAKPHTSEDFPFDETVLVFRVAKKIFALTSIAADNHTVNLKCDPERAIELRLHYPDEILPGYHMNKKHWNTVNYQTVAQPLVQELIDHSYNLVVKSLPKRTKTELGLDNDGLE